MSSLLASYRPGYRGPQPPLSGSRAMKHRIAVVAGIVGVVAAALIALFVGADPKTDPLALDTNQLEGRQGPPIITEDSEGRPFRLRDYRGRWVLLNFFASWCGPCITEHPELVAFSEAHKADGDASVVSVAYNDPPETVRNFFDTNGGDWAVVADNGDISLDYGVVGLPESYLIDPDGIVVRKFVGGVTKAEVEAAMERR